MSCYASKAQIKRGTTIGWPVAFTSAPQFVGDPALTPIDLTGQVITCEVRDLAFALISTLTVTVLDQVTNTGQLILSGDSAGWPIGDVQLDIKRVLGDDEAAVWTDTVILNVVQQVTV